ncbi:MAG: hypothetical protein A2W91_11850 [Bacteroidetes bacterium GWF2_38_335]|nr:MAG: hypothetical protein A2W91_11850 [Bacteroidetes bacterium GWF2_38_335]OFY77971.1 MAG: hypothetical protein A2281_18595 [Bacteroidetes bacterium RIFOXYA12_FULL_38_20]HBS86714.1 hypothetical protein [Bacteroidales bacterium]
MKILKILKTFFRYFLQGLLYTAPLGATAYIIYFIFSFTSNFLEENYVEGYWIGIVAIILLITFLGYIGRTIIAQPLMALVEQILKNTPFVKFVYSSIKDVLGAFVGKDKKFKKPVLVKMYGTEIEKIGFVTQSDLSVLNIVGKKVAVYFPYTYTFMGELFIVPAESVTPLNIPTSDALKFVISGGVTNVNN